MQDCFTDELKKQDVEYKCNVSLASISPIGIGASAGIVVYPDNAEKLMAVVRCLKSTGLEYRVAGRMSNILPPDSDTSKIIIKTDRMNRYYVAENTLVASCGAFGPKVIRNLARDGYSFADGLCGIPGSIGGMIYSNAGAFGSAISDNLLFASVYFPYEDKVLTIEKADMQFSYRKSILSMRESILIEAAFSLSEEAQEKITSRIMNMQHIRRTSQPHGEKSLGSVFKRVDGIPISRLIDELGLKGFCVGGAEVSKKHAGFIINRNNATAADFLALMEFVRARVKEQYGILPVPEIELL